ncbi:MULTISPECIES: sodium/glutamate symporter [unclassified Chelatococcus]|uniref:sodium/glutamate symporter n=1 Tax=unclassified Chelatococcus TaxID=2638111 RepID=UPI001BCE2A72|nr:MULTISPECIES: sodium/glutamate symporter [unclassified Chelatococcus]CAH1656730.1 Sodium/glutamate symporter [Hyphomicrobiales bacterium]MBS7740578.1 sodium/glutamate symporter [Chelatococcus sp. HY11]MBX3544638.1 sodium/glutamate symporter [Chelatococcus sp.]MCO5078179.1 sodium/glutamate symporter [Chelatococcus sp.]CAH1684650.1 Sodium/glutamate symporter [Hyphomicrobiales bacterium]
MTTIAVPGLLSFTIAILVYFTGAGLNRVVEPLRRWNIPEAVTGGLIAAVVTLAAYHLFDTAVTFDLEARDMLLLYFFTGIGLNARLSDLMAGGRRLAILLAITIVFLVLQNIIAVGSVALLGLPDGLAAFLGSASLIGGHGTTIAWAPIIEQRFGIPQALEVGIASATLGLVIASLVGGPVARLLIARYGLSGPLEKAPIVGLPDDPDGHVRNDVSAVSLLRTILVLNIAILIGFTVDELLEELGINLPLFVACLMVAIVMTNTIPYVFRGLLWPTRTKALSLVSDLSLSVFLAMSLMSMQLWTLGDLGPALLLVLGVQTVAAVAYILFVVFPAMGRDYDAAVVSAGFSGISLGATPTAIANMTAVTKVHGAAPIAFIILPLVSAFFIDIANAVAIGFMVR